MASIIHTFVDGDHLVRVTQEGPDNFTVAYGQDRPRYNLNYDEAAKMYGLCVFHSLACAGKLEVSE